MKKAVAIVTYVSRGNFDANTADENIILQNVLAELGISSEQVPWSDPEADWSAYDCLLIKSTWDYFDFYPEFLAWIEQVQALNIPVLNSLEIVRWNSDKAYLHEIQDRGFDVIAGLSLAKNQEISLPQILEAIPEGDFVFKPKVSGGAKNTFRVARTQLADFEQKANELIQEEEFLVQPYISEVAEVGEYSMIFFNSTFSHAVLKSPAKDDFRVQHYFGGQIKAISPEPAMLATAVELVKTFCQDSLYVRVDGVWRGGKFHLMELEMIEPYLFLTEVPGAQERYKDALAERLVHQLQIPTTDLA